MGAPGAPRCPDIEVRLSVRGGAGESVFVTQCLGSRRLNAVTRGGACRVG